MSNKIYDVYSDIVSSSSFQINDSVLEKLNSYFDSTFNFSLILIGGGFSDFKLALVAIHERDLSLVNNIKSDFNFQNTEIVKIEETSFFENTPMHIDKIPQYIKNIEIIKSGKGYTGTEKVVIGGTPPVNWKSVWPQTTTVGDLFILDESDGSIIRSNPQHYLLTGINWSSDTTLRFNSEPTIEIEQPTPDQPSNSSSYLGAFAPMYYRRTHTKG